MLFVISICALLSAVEGVALKELVEGLEVGLERYQSDITAEEADKDVQFERFRLNTLEQIKNLSDSLSKSGADFAGKDQWLEAKITELDEELEDLSACADARKHEIEDLAEKTRHAVQYLTVEDKKLDAAIELLRGEFKAEASNFEARDTELEAENSQLKSEIEALKLNLEREKKEISLNAKMLRGIKEDLEEWKDLFRVKGKIMIGSGLSSNKDRNGSPVKNIWDGDTATGAGTVEEDNPLFGARLDLRFKALKLVLFGVNNLGDDVYTVSVRDNRKHVTKECTKFRPGGNSTEFKDLTVECSGVGDTFYIKVHNENGPTSLYLSEVEAFLVV